MSLVELHERDLTTSSTWQVVNPIKVRLFSEAILRSKASAEKTERPSAVDLRNILDDLNNAMSDEDALAELSAANGTDQAVWEFNRFLARMASTQIADQDVPAHQRCGRLIGMFNYLPQENRDRIAAKDRELVQSVLQHIPNVLGDSVHGIVSGGFFLFNLYLRRFRGLRRGITSVPPDTGDNLAVRGRAAEALLHDLLHTAAREDLVTTPQAVASLTKGLIPARCIVEVLRLMSRTTEELRELRETDPAYRLGHPSTSLHPLDRFPIVRLDKEIEEGSRFLIPNCRLMIKALPIALDDTLHRALGDEYNQARGALHELYLHCLVEHYLPSIHIVAERVYGKVHRRGPDLTLVEGEGGGLLVIEAKARRIAAATRHLLYRELLDRNLEDAFRALGKMPEKVEALYAGLAEYEDVQEVLNSTRGNEPFCVVVLSDAVFAMSELLRIDAEARSDHPLRGLPYKYAVVGIDTFERAVHVASQQGRSLREIFEEHWEVSGRNLRPPYDHSSGNADAIGGVRFPEDETFGASFLYRAGQEWKARTLESLQEREAPEKGRDDGVVD